MELECSEKRLTRAHISSQHTYMYFRLSVFSSKHILVLTQSTDLGDKYQDEQCLDDAPQMLQPPLSSGVSDDSRRTVSCGWGDCEQLWKDHAAWSDATCTHQRGAQGVLGVGWSVADMLCAVLEKGVILSKQVGIKLVASGCLQTEELDCRQCNDLLCAVCYCWFFHLAVWLKCVSLCTLLHAQICTCTCSHLPC